MKAVKENKVYTIDESQRKTYAALGFDITDDSGRILEYAAGKTVPYAKYAALLDENTGSIPGFRRSPGGGHGNPLQYSCQENPHEQKSLQGYNPRGCKESDTTKATKQQQQTGREGSFRPWGSRARARARSLTAVLVARPPPRAGTRQRGCAPTMAREQ